MTLSVTHDQLRGDDQQSGAVPQAQMAQRVIAIGVGALPIGAAHNVPAHLVFAIANPGAWLSGIAEHYVSEQ